MLFCPRLGSLKIVQRCPNFAAFAAAVKIFCIVKHMAHDAAAVGRGAGLAKAVIGRGGEIGVFGVARGLVAMRAFNHHQLQACGLHSGYKILRVALRHIPFVQIKNLDKRARLPYWLYIRQSENPKTA